jgi:hypothetical protein
MWRCVCSSSYAALCLFVVLCDICWFFVLVQCSLVQIDIFTSTHYRFDEDLDANIVDQGIWIFRWHLFFNICRYFHVAVICYINLVAARLFADSPFLIFNNLQFIMIYVSFNLNEWIYFSVKKFYLYKGAKQSFNLLITKKEKIWLKFLNLFML